MPLIPNKKILLFNHLILISFTEQTLIAFTLIFLDLLSNYYAKHSKKNKLGIILLCKRVQQLGSFMAFFQPPNDDKPFSKYKYKIK